MNNFQANSLAQASTYLTTQLKKLKQKSTYGETQEEQNVYIVEPKKESLIKRIANSIFK